MRHRLTVLAVTLVLSVAGVAAVSATGENDKLTICHKPGEASGNKTMEISRSAWSGHKGHGDYEGACGSKAPGRPSGTPPPPPPPPPTSVGVAQQGEGDLDGDASFRITVANEGDATAYGLRLAGTLRGDGRWSVRPASDVQCSITQDRLDCKLADLKGGAETSVRLEFDGHLAVCDAASIDLLLTATNDLSRGDDGAKGSVWLGACSPLDPDGQRDSLTDPTPSLD